MHLELRSNRALFMSEGKVSTCHIAVPVRGTFISVSARYRTDKLEGCITTVIRAPVRCSKGTGSGTITTVSHSIKFQHVTSGTRPGGFSRHPDHRQPYYATEPVPLANQCMGLIDHSIIAHGLLAPVVLVQQYQASDQNVNMLYPSFSLQDLRDKAHNLSGDNG